MASGRQVVHRSTCEQDVETYKVHKSKYKNKELIQTNKADQRGSEHD